MCARTQSRSVSSATTRASTAAAKSSSGRKNVQFRAASAPGTVVPGAASRRSTGTSRLFFSTACASSCAQTSEASESGVITKRKLSEDSMPRYTSSSHSAVIGMSSQSAQMSLSCAASAAYSSRTNSTSRREYEMKTSGIVRRPA